MRPLRARSRSGRLGSVRAAYPFEHVSAEYGFFPKARDDNHGPHSCRERSPISDQIMVGLINRIGPEKRHQDRLHEKFEWDAERDADEQARCPALGPHVADLRSEER